VESQKRGFVPPAPGYLHLQHHRQHGLLQTTSGATAHVHGGYPPYPAALYPAFFPATAAGDVRGPAETTTVSPPVGLTQDVAGGYAGSTGAGPPTPPVTPGNRHQLPSLQQQQQQQQIGAVGHVNSSISPSGICTITFTDEQTLKRENFLAICRPSGCTVMSGDVVVVVGDCNRSQMRTSKCTCLIFGVSIGLDPG